MLNSAVLTWRKPCHPFLCFPPRSSHTKLRGFQYICRHRWSQFSAAYLRISRERQVYLKWDLVENVLLPTQEFNQRETVVPLHKRMRGIRVLYQVLASEPRYRNETDGSKTGLFLQKCFYRLSYFVKTILAPLDSIQLIDCNQLKKKVSYWKLKLNIFWMPIDRSNKACSRVCPPPSIPVSNSPLVAFITRRAASAWEAPK